MKKEFKVSGMTCKHCVARVEKGISELSGVEKVKVNLKKERATVKFDQSQVTENQIIDSIVTTGYEAEVI